ncbi:MAG: hypothetical protein GX594_18005 [Pirellulaceae bacterium]|nr:hypothetical protein [Pirellulaceae bacterium]
MHRRYGGGWPGSGSTSVYPQKRKKGTRAAAASRIRSPRRNQSPFTQPPTLLGGF